MPVFSSSLDPPKLREIKRATTLKEVKRIPMRRPVGKYNVYNKINRSEGTSH